MNVGQNGGRHLARASSAITGGNRDVLLAVDAVRDRKTLNRGSEARVEKHLARVHIDGFEMAVQASRKYEPPGGRYASRKERCPLFYRPTFLPRFYRLGFQVSHLSYVP